jgi:hypothetical protein
MPREALAKAVDPERRAIEILDHHIAFATGDADHRMAEVERHLDPEIAGGVLQGVDVDGLGIDQQAIHVEKDGFNGFPQHAFVLSCPAERARERKIHAHP